MNAAESLVALVWQSPRLAETTKELYAARVRDFADFAGPQAAGRWTPYDVERWRDSLAQRGLEPKSINLYLGAVRYVSKRLAVLNRDPGLDFASPAETLRVIGDKHPRQYALSKTQCKDLLDRCADPLDPVDLRDRAMILVGIHTALRRSEIIGIQFDDVDGRRKRIAAITKGGKSHSVGISPQLWNALRAWATWLRSRGITSGPMFRRINRGHPGERALTANGLYKILQKRGRACGIEKLHPHVLRHTFVWLALDAGVPVWRVQLVMGHQSKLMTLYYAEDLTNDAVGASFDL